MKKIKKFLILTLCLTFVISMCGCGKNKNAEEGGEDTSQSQEIEVEVKNKAENAKDKSEAEATDPSYPVAVIDVAGFGTIEAELYPQTAPNTVYNFIMLANKGFYDGTTFHRVIKDFMIQGGDPEGTGRGGPGYSIKGEFSANGVENTLTHVEGVISMARSNKPDSAGSQFFIVTKTSPHLDNEYAAFGKVISGMDIVHNIENVKTGENDKPEEEVKITSIRVDTKGAEYPIPEILK